MASQKSTVRPKKAGFIALDTLVKIIIPIAFFMIFAPIIVNVMGNDVSQIEKTCELSVASRASFALKIGSGTDLKGFPLVCKTLDVKVKKGDRDDVMEQIADKTARCWEMFGKGQYETDIFSNFELFGSNKCFTCYNMLVQESSKFEDDDIISPQEFMTYLETNIYRDDVTYLEYIQYVAGGPGRIQPVFVADPGAELDQNYNLQGAGIAPNRAYAIAYSSKTDECEWCEYALFGGYTTAVVGGAVAAGSIAILLAPATGGTSIIAGTLAVKGALLGGGIAAIGGTTAAAGGAGLASDAFFEQRNIDTIYIVDVTNSQLKHEFYSSCPMVEDIAGN